MASEEIYHEGMRGLQDARDTRRIADRLVEVTLRTSFSEEDRAFIQRCPMFFVATADAEGRPDCSYKGGLPGFVRVVDQSTLAFPDYDGNGMKLVEHSAYAPREAYQPPVPERKKFDVFRDHLPERDRSKPDPE